MVSLNTDIHSTAGAVERVTAGAVERVNGDALEWWARGWNDGNINRLSIKGECNV